MASPRRSVPNRSDRVPESPESPNSPDLRLPRYRWLLPGWGGGQLELGQRLALATIETDLSGIRAVAAIRRCAVVVAVLIMGRELFSDQVGVSAAIAALLIGLLDKGPSTRAAALMMVASTGLFATVTLAAGLVSSYAALNVALMTSLAFAAGVGVAVNKRCTQVLLFAAVMAASFSIRPVEPNTALASAVAVIVAGAAQTVLTWLSGPFMRDWPERRKLIAAMRITALALAKISAGVDATVETKIASQEINEAGSLISASDLSNSHRDLFQLLLANIDELRLEARALSSRARLGLKTTEDTGTRQVIAAAANLLDQASAVLSRRFNTSRQLGAELTAEAAALLSLVNNPADVNNSPLRENRLDAENQSGGKNPLVGKSPTIGKNPTELELPPDWIPTRTAQAIADSCAQMVAQLRALTDRRSGKRSHQKSASPLLKRTQAALKPGSPSLRQGIRVALAALCGDLLGIALGLNYTSWVAVTAMMVLRPDVGPTLPRIITRAIGVTLGVGLIGLLLLTRDPSTFWIIVIVTASTFLLYTFAPVNNAIMVGIMTALVVSLLALAGADPARLAGSRLLDVLVGCGVGTLFAFLIPIWARSKLPAAVAAYAKASSEYFAALRICAQASLGVQPAEANESAPGTSDQTSGFTTNTTAEVTELTMSPGASRAVSSSGSTTDSTAVVRIDPNVLLLARVRAQTARSTGRAAEEELRIALLEPASKAVDCGLLSIVIAWIMRSNEAGVSAEALLRHGRRPGPKAPDYAALAARELAACAALLDTLPSSHQAGHGWVDSLSIDERDDPNRISQSFSRAARNANSAHRAATRARQPAQRAR